MTTHRSTHTDDHGRNRSSTRRAYLTVIGTTAGVALAGCTGSDDQRTTAPPPEPVDLSGGKQDDQGGMVIGEHYGPNGQLFYHDHTPDGHNNPAEFMSLTAGLFPYYFSHREKDWTLVAAYATDYSAVDYDLTTVEGTTYISSPTAASSFGPARELTYVAGSDVTGGMGKALVPFSSGDDVSSFIDEHGGRRLAFDDVTPDWLGSYVRQ